MAKSYPLLPSAVWWKLRDQFQKSLPGTVSRSYLATVLGIEDKSAGNLLGPLKAVGLIGDDGKPTERANHWRFDDDYAEVCRTIRDEVYPRELIDAIPDPSANREGTVRWFMRNAGVGENGAKKMSVTYELVSQGDPARRPEAKEPRQPKTRPVPSTREQKGRIEAGESTESATRTGAVEPQHRPERPRPINVGSPQDGPPSLHIDIQVHISADASTDQIDQIFASMARHLYGKK